MDFYEAYSFLRTHPIFHNNFLDCLDVMVVKDFSSPDDGTRTRVCLECGPYREQILTHDYALDSEADTFEEAIILLAEHVKSKYGSPDIKALMENRRNYNRRSDALIVGLFSDEDDEDN